MKLGWTGMTQGSPQLAWLTITDRYGPQRRAGRSRTVIIHSLQERIVTSLVTNMLGHSFRFDRDETWLRP